MGNQAFKAHVTRSMNLPATIPNKTLFSRIQVLAKENPITTAVTLTAGLDVISTSLTDIFDGEEFPQLAKAMAEASGPKGIASKNEVDKYLGDRESGTRGTDDNDLMESADKIKKSIDIVDTIINGSGLSCEYAERLVQAIQMVEPADFVIYKQFKGN